MGKGCAARRSRRGRVCLVCGDVEAPSARVEVSNRSIRRAPRSRSLARGLPTPRAPDRSHAASRPSPASSRRRLACRAESGLRGNQSLEASCRSFDDFTSTRVEERTIQFRLVQEGPTRPRRGREAVQNTSGIPASVVDFHTESGAQSSSSSSEEAASAGSASMGLQGIRANNAADLRRTGTARG